MWSSKRILNSACLFLRSCMMQLVAIFGGCTHESWRDIWIRNTSVTLSKVFGFFFFLPRMPCRFLPVKPSFCFLSPHLTSLPRIPFAPLFTIPSFSWGIMPWEYVVTSAYINKSDAKVYTSVLYKICLNFDTGVWLCFWQHALFYSAVKLISRILLK